jgi:hypothetical protein
MFTKAYAQVMPSTGSFPTNFTAFVELAMSILNPVIGLVFTAGVLMFIWGLAKMILNAADEKEVIRGKSLMLWGLVALFVMASVFGILNFFFGELGFTNFGIPQFPI